MKLRKIKIKDSASILEWMTDKEISSFVLNMPIFSNKPDIESYIEKINDTDSVCFAITSDKDEYMGSVAISNIDRVNKTGEFSIAIRRSAFGCGYSWFGMKSILDIAFKKENLKYVYWCVSINNIRALRFFEKHHFNEMLDVKQEYLAHHNSQNLKWFILTSDDDYCNKKGVAILGCPIINIKTIGTEGAGQLSFFESFKDFSFETKRIYYISKVPEGKRRGFHAHKNLKQLIFCPYGKINLVLDDGQKREEIILDNPSVGVLIDKPIWREMVWLQKDSILCVAASDFYDESDYIRSYSDFKKLVDNQRNK